MPLTEEAVSACTSLLLQIDELAPQLNLLPPAPDVREILNRPVVRTAYADELNAASLVFHNRRTQEASLDDILMTGDAAPETFEQDRKGVHVRVDGCPGDLVSDGKDGDGRVEGEQDIENFAAEGAEQVGAEKFAHQRSPPTRLMK